MTTLNIPPMIGASDLRVRAREILDHFLVPNCGPLVVQRWGKAVAVIMPIERYNDLTNYQPTPTNAPSERE